MLIFEKFKRNEPFQIVCENIKTSHKSYRMGKNIHDTIYGQKTAESKQRHSQTYPLNTPKTKLRTKKDPKMTRLTK